MIRSPHTRRTKGATLIEFAFAWSIGWILLTGLYQTSYTFYTYEKAQDAVQIAAQAAAQHPYDLPTHGAAAISEIQNLPVFRDVPGLSPAAVRVDYELDNQNVPQRVTVSIAHLDASALFIKFTLDDKPRSAQPFLGPVTCTGC